MIVVNVRFELDDGVLDKVKDAIVAMERASRAETGCVDYCFSTEIDNPNAVRITERWESESALAAHFQTPHMAAFREAIAGIDRRGFDGHFWAVTEIERPG